MRRLLFSAAVIVGVVAWGLVPATATPLAISGFSSQNVEATLVEEVGYWRRQYRRYGYPVPYAYYPPAYGYYAPPPAYAYYPPRMAPMRLRPRRMVNIHPGMPTTATIRPRMATRATIRPRMGTNPPRAPCVCEPGGSSQC